MLAQHPGASGSSPRMTSRSGLSPPNHTLTNPVAAQLPIAQCSDLALLELKGLVCASAPYAPIRKPASLPSGVVRKHRKGARQVYP